VAFALQESVSSTFYTCIFIQKFAQSQTLSREKLLNLLLYEKFVRKMLMKLTPALAKSALSLIERIFVFNESFNSINKHF
jgi:hypothetical protein